MTEMTVQIENQMAEFKPFEASLKVFKHKYDGVVYDLTDKKQEKQARSDQYAIGKVVANLDRKHKEIKAPLAELVKLVDGKRKQIKDDLKNVQSKIKKQIEQHEAKIAEHEAMLLDKFNYIKSLSVFDGWTPNAHDIKVNLDLATGQDIDDSFEHYKDEAEIELKSQIDKLTQMHEAALKSEAEAAELERLRKEAAEREARERDERLKREAAERARIEAEQKAAAEIARIEAEKEQAKIEAENAKREAERKAAEAVAEERARAEHEAAQKAAKQKAEQEAIERKKAQKRHVSSVLSKVKKSLVDHGISKKEASTITDLIHSGEVDHVQIIF